MRFERRTLQKALITQSLRRITKTSALRANQDGAQYEMGG
jgi:hypothetical protein